VSKDSVLKVGVTLGIAVISACLGASIALWWVFVYVLKGGQ
jgi:hypothetical protein